MRHHVETTERRRRRQLEVTLRHGVERRRQQSSSRPATCLEIVETLVTVSVAARGETASDGSHERPHRGEADHPSPRPRVRSREWCRHGYLGTGPCRRLRPTSHGAWTASSSTDADGPAFDANAASTATRTAPRCHRLRRLPAAGRTGCANGSRRFSPSRRDPGLGSEVRPQSSRFERNPIELASQIERAALASVLKSVDGHHAHRCCAQPDEFTEPQEVTSVHGTCPSAWTGGLELRQ